MVPESEKIWLGEIVRRVCHDQRINLDLMRAIINTESSWNRFAMRFEPNWKYLLQVDDFASSLGITSDTEKVLQSCSYGLVQVMGSVCRELGYKGPLVKLCDPYLNVSYGCQKIRRLYVRYGEDNESDVIAAYNAGSARKTSGGMYENQTYVDRVTKTLRGYRALIS